MKHFRGMGLGICLAVAALLNLSTPNQAGAALRPGEIPPALEPWQGWVLHGQQEALCPPQYNDGAVSRCQWPARLSLELSTDGGRFEQRWLMFSQGWVALPGNQDLWPDTVTIDGQPAAVIERDHTPSVALDPGEHRLQGRFFWNRLPEMIQVPPALGLLALTIEGRKIDFPVIDGQGRLWLQKSDSAAGGEDRLKVQVFRLLSDTIPMQVTTVLRLDVSGKAREIPLNNAFLVNAVPMDLDSQLPARIDGQGRLLVQARAGRWEIRIKSRILGPVNALTAGQTPYGDEIWSFQAQHQLRIVEIQGVAPLEPSQTEMPAGWRRLPAYRVKAGATLKFKEIRRGDPDPSPDQLTLQRTWWLDFDGRGFSVHDRISGTLSRQWYLAMNAPQVLGRVAVDGQDRVLTQQGPDQKAGVELRHGQLALQADSRLPERAGALSALGWDHDFQQVSALLHLPPGWRLLAASGVDQVSQAWLQRWSLLDFFLVLIIALAVFKLRTWQWGLLALAAMVLIFHEPGAPRLVWLHILAVLALLPRLPAGWFKRSVGLWGMAAAVVLLVITIPFMIHQIRWGIYPQLAPAGGFTPRPAGFEFGRAKKAVEAPAPQSRPALEPEEELSDQMVQRKMAPMVSSGSIMRGEERFKADQAVDHLEPDALIPTGPGLPDWQWQTIQLRWNGPVAKDQTLRLHLLPPWLNLVLALLRVGLLAALIWGLSDWRSWYDRLRPHIPAGPLLAALLLVSMGAQVARAATVEQTFPPPSLLEELKQRLVEKPDCLPHCADISRLELAAADDELQVMLKLHAAERTAVPLPVNRKSWAPDQILLDNAPISGLARDESGQLWALVPEGLHTIILLGTTAEAGVVLLPLPLKPHMATYAAKGWAVKGIQPDGRVGSSIQMTRLQPGSGNAGGAQGGGALPAFLNVQRVLHLGLTWQISTTIKRVTPTGSPVVVSIPLLPEEAITTAGLQVDQGQVLINLASDQRVLTYRSTLPVTSRIELEAPRAVPWTETWILDASPIWHCDLEGIAVIHHQDRSGQWQPRWQPWPGERVTIRVRRPAAVGGQTITIDRADMVLSPGQRFGRGELNLTIRTSRGGQHTLVLPPKANLQSVTMDGRSLPIRQDGQFVTVPLQPGSQAVNLQWHQLAPFAAWFKTPLIKVGEKAVNARVTLNMPAKRWILLAGGPRWGPAVLFWSYLTVIVLAALGLGRISLTPLKTWQWLLLGLGLTQIPALMALIIVSWLLLLGLRERQHMPDRVLAFNALQTGLALWTLVALVCLFAAVKAGLVGQPEMQIEGNQSDFMQLHWTQDRITESMPRPWVVSLPVWCFRLLMLAWSLWLALALLQWLKWGWQCFSKESIWRKIQWRKPKADRVSASEQADKR